MALENVIWGKKPNQNHRPQAVGLRLDFHYCMLCGILCICSTLCWGVGGVHEDGSDTAIRMNHSHQVNNRQQGL